MDRFNILFIDSYDSFSYNLIRLIESQSIDNGKGIQVTVIHNDTFDDLKELLAYINIFECIVIGPGPGNPVNGAKDIGIISALFNSDQIEIPILGVCLGFQAMCYYHGATIEELKTIKHGQVEPIEIDTSVPLFENCPPVFKSTRYHSLHVSNYEGNDNIEPLAFTYDENGKLLMAAKIKGKPYYGVQYHPESCCSEYGDKLIENFLKITQSHHKETSIRSNSEQFLRSIHKSIDIRPTYLNSYNSSKSPEISIQSYRINEGGIDMAKLFCDSFPNLSKFLLLSSKFNKKFGKWSIIALPDDSSTVFTHYESIKKTTVHSWQDPRLKVSEYKKNVEEGTSTDCLTVLPQDKSKFWDYIGNFMKDHISYHYDNKLPFIGGLVGILGYEMGQYVEQSGTYSLQPDAKLAFISNSIVIDHEIGKLYTISLSGSFPQELTDFFVNFNSSAGIESEGDDSTGFPDATHFAIEKPNAVDYMRAFKKCQRRIHCGDSYEICLTTQSIVQPSKTINPWIIYKKLLKMNPSPFSSFFEFNDLIGSEDILYLLSSSPERFIEWDQNICELRPIKGTVKKGRNMDLKRASEILKTPKEFGENLMILDLIRNDLHQLVKDVQVTEFMSIEEYETVYQLVSVIRASGIQNSVYSGFDFLRNSLPPGSMTGAPKKITVELLQKEIENELNEHIHPDGSRGVYSGVSGYWSVNDHSDWSVNIRCMYSYDGGKKWLLGAGGAITALSTLDGEWEEMQVKLDSALQVFE
ncbi:hypothetical protein KAFR_0C04620 [Kazachstania africana CBS 2517]|uniref:aminodeoxychorismate synthase n=1 Tax=Kazachstania africana (strain ATCC 22294 / BCRC 22015 / CBS 2517 / CECT 1963 / NBRC 1671 / NRRL Y-8276) TaxID=1071382 RepID=H2ASV3_KAZAF|nr:hypothetical protein KAFR_0C04620 [Kazachstania africana CBS 2517]CCF57453.1 hypothetical protein KAFR_0C04620 [Kazachstania africana CBS 2517]